VTCCILAGCIVLFSILNWITDCDQPQRFDLILVSIAVVDFTSDVQLLISLFNSDDDTEIFSGITSTTICIMALILPALFNILCLSLWFRCMKDKTDDVLGKWIFDHPWVFKACLFLGMINIGLMKIFTSNILPGLTTYFTMPLHWIRRNNLFACGKLISCLFEDAPMLYIQYYYLVRLGDDLDTAVDPETRKALWISFGTSCLSFFVGIGEAYLNQGCICDDKKNENMRIIRYNVKYSNYNIRKKRKKIATLLKGKFNHDFRNLFIEISRERREDKKRECCGNRQLGNIMNFFSFLPKPDSMYNLHFTMVCYNVEQGHDYNFEEIFSTVLRQACKNYEGEKTISFVHHGIRDMFGNLAGAAKRIASHSSFLDWKIQDNVFSIQFQSSDPDSNTSKIREILKKDGGGKASITQSEIDKIIQNSAELLTSGREESILLAENTEFPKSVHTSLELTYDSKQRQMSMFEKRGNQYFRTIAGSSTLGLPTGDDGRRGSHSSESYTWEEGRWMGRNAISPTDMTYYETPGVFANYNFTPANISKRMPESRVGISREDEPVSSNIAKRSPGNSITVDRIEVLEMSQTHTTIGGGNTDEIQRNLDEEIAHSLLCNSEETIDLQFEIE